MKPQEVIDLTNFVIDGCADMLDAFAKEEVFTQMSGPAALKLVADVWHREYGKPKE